MTKSKENSSGSEKAANKTPPGTTEYVKKSKEPTAQSDQKKKK